LILEEGLKTPFWELYAEWFMDESQTAMGRALGEDEPCRDWWAGKSSGLKQALKRPFARIQALKQKIQIEQKALKR
jgi:hypothetical protein